jgi:hypothetical protein
MGGRGLACTIVPAQKNSVILVEFNELCPPLMKRFMDRNILPNFRRFHGESEVYTTEAAEKPPYLEPWIQWITVHSGVGYEDHKIFNLDEGHNLAAPALWDVLSDAGLRTWVCGSMNPRTSPSFNGAILPDPWTTKVPAKPAELEPFFKFIQRNVQEYTKDKVPLGARDYAQFGSFMARHGLSKETVVAIVKQLASEKQSKGKTRWKRATILDRLQFDVFKHYYKTLDPHFATFFSNSTAHFQHMHWRNMEPDLFKVAPTAEEQAQYHDAIEYGYRSMDRMVGELLDLAGRDTTLVFVTAISQQPCTLYEEQGGKVAYRPKEFEKLLKWAGVEGNFTIAPVMTQYFHVAFSDERAAGAAAEKLKALRAADTHALHVDHNGKELFCGCRIYKKLGDDLKLENTANGTTTRFFDQFYKIEGMKSGMHHPDGMLWVRTPARRHQVHGDKVPLERVAPMILDMFSVARPTTMRAQPLDGFAALAAP